MITCLDIEAHYIRVYNTVDFGKDWYRSGVQ